MAERFRPYVTVAAIVECRNKYLLVSEYDEAPTPVYGQVAGHLEANEDLIEGIKRELLEEAGISNDPDYLVGIYTYVKDNETIQRYCFYLKDDSLPEELIPSDPDQDIISAKWYTKEEVEALQPHYRTRLVKKCFDDFFKGKKFSLDLLDTIRP